MEVLSARDILEEFRGSMGFYGGLMGFNGIS
jgi:hypothetical protein